MNRNNCAYLGIVKIAVFYREAMTPFPSASPQEETLAQLNAAFGSPPPEDLIG